jgi:hypothetical protein
MWRTLGRTLHRWLWGQWYSIYLNPNGAIEVEPLAAGVTVTLQYRSGQRLPRTRLLLGRVHSRSRHLTLVVATLGIEP